MGNIHGRFEPSNSTDKALLIGSHMVRTINCVFCAVILSVIKEPSLTKIVLYLKKNRTLSLMLACTTELWVLFVQSLL
jgi:allantoate deiminase